jgi:hypothetical protein
VSGRRRSSDKFLGYEVATQTVGYRRLELLTGSRTESSLLDVMTWEDASAVLMQRAHADEPKRQPVRRGTESPSARLNRLMKEE